MPDDLDKLEEEIQEEIDETTQQEGDNSYEGLEARIATLEARIIELEQQLLACRSEFAPAGHSHSERRDRQPESTHFWSRRIGG